MSDEDSVMSRSGESCALPVLLSWTATEEGPFTCCGANGVRQVGAEVAIAGERGGPSFEDYQIERHPSRKSDLATVMRLEVDDRLSPDMFEMAHGLATFPNRKQLGPWVL
jgi:hypothetical protein